MNIRRLLRVVILVLACLLLVAGTALADGSQEGALRAAFNTHGSAADTIIWHVPNGQAAGVAAPVQGFEGRISPFQLEQTFCDEQVLGTWVTWFTGYPGVANKPEAEVILGGISNMFRLDGVELTSLERTPIYRFFPTFHDADQFWGFTEGVPVLGSLEAGLHTLELEAYEGGDLIAELTVNFEVLVCGE